MYAVGYVTPMADHSGDTTEYLSDLFDTVQDAQTAAVRYASFASIPQNATSVVVTDLSSGRDVFTHVISR